MEGIQEAFSSNCMPPLFLSNQKTRGSENRKARNDQTLANRRTVSSFFGSMMRNTPTSGKNSVKLRMWSLKKSIFVRPLPQEVISQRQHSRHDYECVILHAAGLQHAHGERKNFSSEAGQTHGAVHDVGVPQN